MFINYYDTMSALGYECLKDKQLMDSFERKTIHLNLKVILLIVFNIFSFRTNFQEGYKLENNLPKKVYYTDKLLLSQIRCGSSNPEEKVNENLKEINCIYKLKNDILSNSPSFNKSLMDIYNKIIDPFLNIFLENNEARLLLKTFLEKPTLPNNVPNLRIRAISSKETSLKNPEKISLFADAAIVPVNSRFWLAHGFGARIPIKGTNNAFKTNTDVISEALNTPVANFKTSCEYLYRSKSEVEYRTRFWRLFRDTCIVNSFSINDPGAFLGGVYASNVAEKYMKEMVDRELYPNEIEKLNMQIYKQVAKSKNIPVDFVEGTGLFREFVDEQNRADLCKIPKNKRPIWEEETYNSKLGDKDSYQ